MKAYKGFNPDMTCRGFQYEVGKEYEHKGKVETCESGFHACENPMDVLGFYPPANDGKLSRYCEVEQAGELKKDGDKTASSRIHIAAEIGLNGLIKAGVKFIFDRVKWDEDKKENTGNYSAATNTGNRSAATNTGDYSAATNTGDYSAATNTGDRSAATNTGDRSAATVEGSDSIAIVTGYQGKAKGALGCWLVLTERDNDYHILDVQAVKVDGDKIKADTFYTLSNGKITETE